MPAYQFDVHSLGYRDSLKSIRFLFDRFVGQPCRMLEIGVYEGGSACWFLDEILTHPASVYVGVDDNLRQVARDNLARHGAKAQLLCGDSKSVLPLITEPVNIVYIDGDHAEDAVASDLLYSWQLLQPGGVILLDDYDRADYGVKAAVTKCLDTFLPESYRVLYKGYKFAFRKES